MDQAEPAARLYALARPTQVEMRRAIAPAFWITTTGPRSPRISILFLRFSSERPKSAG